jgi:hypothetical protein
MKTAEARLWRFLPPFTRTVTLRQISVQGFMDLVRIWVSKISAQRINNGGPITGDDILKADSREQFITSADLFAIGLRARWFSGWASSKNAGRMIDATIKIHNWSRLFGCLNLTGKPKKGAGIMGDVMTLARIWSTSPESILNWPMEQFLDVVDSMSAQIEHDRRAEDPTLDPNADPMPLGSLGLPGVEVIH